MENDIHIGKFHLSRYFHYNENILLYYPIVREDWRRNMLTSIYGLNSNTTFVVIDVMRGICRDVTTTVQCPNSFITLNNIPLPLQSKDENCAQAETHTLLLVIIWLN